MSYVIYHAIILIQTGLGCVAVQNRNLNQKLDCSPRRTKKSFSDASLSSSSLSFPLLTELLHASTWNSNSEEQ